MAKARGGAVRWYAHVARLYPSARQAALLDGQGQAARALRNLIHEWYIWGGRSSSIARRPSFAQMDWQIREARTNPLPGWEWLAQLPAQAAQHVLKDYLRAWDRFHRRLSRPPKFRNRRTQLAIDVPQASALNITRLNHRWAEVTIPLIGRVRFRWTRPLPGISRRCPGRITGARLIKNSLGWHILFRIEEPASEVSANPGPPVGWTEGLSIPWRCRTALCLTCRPSSLRVRRGVCWGYSAKLLASSSCTSPVRRCPTDTGAPSTRSPGFGPDRPVAARTGCTA